MKLNHEIFHKFFYSGEDESGRNFLRVYGDFSSFLELVAPKRPAKAILQKIEELAAIANETEDRKKRNELISGLTAKREAAAIVTE